MHYVYYHYSKGDSRLKQERMIAMPDHTAHTIFDPAKWFTVKNNGAIDSKKLQKLCYYAQAWSYALYGKPLFDGEFQAWVHGPVNKALWDTFKDIAFRDITPEDFKERHITVSPMLDNEVSFLERVWVTYGAFTGYQLEMLTHQETPWLEQREGLHPYEGSSKIISASTMREYYRELISRGGNT